MRHWYAAKMGLQINPDHPSNPTTRFSAGDRGVRKLTPPAVRRLRRAACTPATPSTTTSGMA